MTKSTPEEQIARIIDPGAFQPTTWGAVNRQDISLSKARQIAALQAADPPEGIGDEVVLVPRRIASPMIEELTPTPDEWSACQTVQDQYDLMKRRWARALSALHQAGKPADGPWPHAITEAMDDRARLIRFFNEPENYSLGNEGDLSHWTPAQSAIAFIKRYRDLVRKPADPPSPEAALAEYIADYAMSTEGADYTPTDWERELIEDALRGWESERAALAVSHPPEEA